MMSDQLLKLCDLWERQRRGNNAGFYLVGAIGGLKLLALGRNNPDPDGPHWTRVRAERTQRQERPPAHDAERGGGHWSGSQGTRRAGGARHSR
jgi:hypothetical protein